MNKRKKSELTLGIFIFLVLAGSTFLMTNGVPKLTGHVVFETEDVAQIAVQQFFRDSLFSELGDGTKLCLNIEGSNGKEDGYSFKIRKRGDLFTVEPSSWYCEGKNNEDLVFNVLDQQFLESRDEFSVESLLSSHNDGFQVWESKFVKSGGLIMCTEDFQKKVCPLAQQQLTDYNLNRMGLTCCGESMVGKGSILSIFTTGILKYWWLFALLFICFALAGSSLFLFSDKEDKKTDPMDGVDEIKDYIVKTRIDGHRDSVIEKELLEAGWNKKAITYAFEHLRKNALQNFGERFEKLF